MQIHKSENKLRTRFRKETRLVILEAAEGVFARQGAQAARMEDIAEAAGIAVGTLYNYFADRQELVTALLESRRDELLGHIDGALDSSSSRGFEQELEAFLRVVFGHFETHRSLFTLALEDELHAVRCGPRRSWAQKVATRLEAMVERGVRAGTLREADSRWLPAMILGLIRGTVMQAMSRRESLEGLVQSLLAVFMRGAGTR